jgi:cytochrome c-type biogenesis protein CcmH/NrfG
VWLHLGQIEQNLNRPLAAREAYTAALKLNPNFRPATDALEKLK